MPIENLGHIHFTDQQIADINAALEVLMTNLMGITTNLSPKERSKYGKVGNQKILLIDKVNDYRKMKEDMSSPEVDWEEFENDYNDRKQAVQMLAKVKSIEILLMNIKVLRDHDNYTDALRDYQYAKYKNRFGNQAGYSSKIDAIKQFFPKTGKTKQPNDDKT